MRDITRHSVNGEIFLLNGGAVTWSSKKQRTVALSTTEAEYVALGQGTRTALWLRQLLIELNLENYITDNNDKVCVTVRTDSQSALALVKNPEYHARTKHFDIQLHFIREKSENGIIYYEYCSTEKLLADMLTKPLPRDKYRKLVQESGLTIEQETSPT